MCGFDPSGPSSTARRHPGRDHAHAAPQTRQRAPADSSSSHPDCSTSRGRKGDRALPASPRIATERTTRLPVPALGCEYMAVAILMHGPLALATAYVGSASPPESSDATPPPALDRDSPSHADQPEDVGDRREDCSPGEVEASQAEEHREGNREPRADESHFAPVAGPAPPRENRRQDSEPEGQPEEHHESDGPEPDPDEHPEPESRQRREPRDGRGGHHAPWAAPFAYDEFRRPPGESDREAEAGDDDTDGVRPALAGREGKCNDPPGRHHQSPA